jgi:hypothetical protein
MLGNNQVSNQLGISRVVLNSMELVKMCISSCRIVPKMCHIFPLKSGIILFTGAFCIPENIKMSFKHASVAAVSSTYIHRVVGL